VSDLCTLCTIKHDNNNYILNGLSIRCVENMRFLWATVCCVFSEAQLTATTCRKTYMTRCRDVQTTDGILSARFSAQSGQVHERTFAYSAFSSIYSPLKRSEKHVLTRDHNRFTCHPRAYPRMEYAVPLQTYTTRQ